MRRQHGIAIITAMLIIAITTVLAVEMLWETSLDSRRTETMLVRDQALEYSLFGEDLAIAKLRDDAGNPCGLDDVLGKQIPFERSGVRGFGTLVDLQGGFNLNNLVDARGHKDPIVYKQFQRLLTSLEIDPRVADAVVDWLDPDTIPELEGAEDDIYTGLTPPYRTANFWFASVSELLAVQGVTPLVYDKLRRRDRTYGTPVVVALPGTGQFTKIDFNTISDVVRRAFLTDSAGAADLADTSSEKQFACVSSLQELTGKVQPVDLPYLGVTSNYFGLDVTVSIGTYRQSMYSLIERNGQAVGARVRSFDVN